MPAALDTSRDTRRAFAALMAGGVAIGFSPILVRLSDLAPLASGFHRLALAVPVLAAIAAASPRRPPAQSAPPQTGDPWLLVLAGVLFAADIACWHLSLFQTSVADATLISNTAPIMVAVGGLLFFGERLQPLFVAGLALAIAGVASLALQKAGTPIPGNRILGDVLALGAASTYAAYMLIVARLRRRMSAQKVMLAGSTVSALVLLPIAMVLSPALLPSTLMGWGVVIALAMVAQVAGQGLLAYALAHLPAAFSSLTQVLQAAVAAVAAWALFGEALTPLKLASAAAILFGIALCRRAMAATP